MTARRATIVFIIITLLSVLANVISFDHALWGVSLSLALVTIAIALLKYQK